MARLDSDDIIDDFAHDGKMYLNNASVSLMPLQSIDAMRDFLAEYSAMGPDSIRSESFVAEKIQRLRRTISGIINCRQDEIVITQSVTDGINIVANGLSPGPDSEIIIRGRSHEHHANYYPWLRLGQRCRLRSLPVDGHGFFEIDELQLAINENTRLLSLSHGLYNTGAILPVEEAGRIASKNGILYFVDAAQTVGCTGSVDVRDMRCDFMAFNGSKWLCGPMGTGIFYCSRKSSEALTPPDVGGESAMLLRGDVLSYKGLPDRFQAGFRNYAGLVGLESSASYLARIGMANIRKKVIGLANVLREELRRIRGAVVYGPDDEDRRTSIVSFSIDGLDPRHVVERLEGHNTILAVREIMERKVVRASPHLFNSEKDIMRTVDLVKGL